MVPDEHLVISDPKQLAALTSPVRVELLENLGLWGPCSVAELAQRMGRAPDSLYYHVRKLASLGLIASAGERAGAGRPEALYELPARVIEIERYSDGEARAQTSKAIHSVLRLAGRELDEALDDEEILDEGPKRRLYGRRLHGHVTWGAIAEVNRLIGEIETVFARETLKKRRGSQGIALTLMLAPTRIRKERK